ncbi:uncharacterized protein BJX67DRAFT_282480 [Aspergillus lucknowensis]|uniref:Uncharacterized protein n=1 Tax=Aspergillus lucknowensis TaxID=176173 RepID=A0ABR4M0U1_9EURO
MSSNAPSQWAEDKLAEFEGNMERLKKEHPEWNIDMENKWWVPVVSLGDRLNSLDQETRDKISASAAKLFEHNFDPEAVAGYREEAKNILAGYPEVREQILEQMLSNEVGLARAREFALAESAAGREPFANVQKK